MKYIHILLLLIVFLLIAIFFKEDVKSYFKDQEILKNNKARSHEVLIKANPFNILTVANACLSYLVDANENASTSAKCDNMLTSYEQKIARWKILINKNSDIDCTDFPNKTEAQDFYEYISGEYTHEYIGYQKYIRNNPSKALENDGSNDIVFQASSSFNGCHYDPYGIDTNSDCNACEKMK